jgi:hypothetical protein
LACLVQLRVDVVVVDQVRFEVADNVVNHSLIVPPRILASDMKEAAKDFRLPAR